MRDRAAGRCEYCRLPQTGTLVPFKLEKPTGTVDHFAIGIPRYNKDAAVRHFTERGAKPLEGNAFKVALARNTIVAVLGGLAGDAA